MIAAVATALTVFTVFAIVYFATYNLSTFVMVLGASLRVLHSRRWFDHRSLDETFRSPLAPTVSILVPAHNEEAAIVASVRSLLELRYHGIEVVVVDDGSTDATFERLRSEFSLVDEDRPAKRHVTEVKGALLSQHAAPGLPLRVLRKQSTGRRADALNLALRYAEHDLVCMIDADSLLEPDALLRVVQPFLDDPTTIAVGGVVRPANGTTVDRGRVTRVGAPRLLLERIQVVEYLRSFLFARTAWAGVNGLLIISGAFGVFRTSALEAVGGLDDRSLGEDAELVLTLHEHFAQTGEPYRVTFVPEPVCWTEVPDTWRVLARQRRRWAHGLGQILIGHRHMIGRRRFGAVGLLGLPFFVAFEALGAAVELGAAVLVPLGLVTGLVEPILAVLVGATSIALGFLASITALLVEVGTFRRLRRGRDIAALVLASLLENAGYRQAHAWWRLRGLVAALGRREAVWGEMPRRGFAEVPMEMAPR